MLTPKTPTPFRLLSLTRRLGIEGSYFRTRTQLVLENVMEGGVGRERDGFPVEYVWGWGSGLGGSS